MECIDTILDGYGSGVPVWRSFKDDVGIWVRSVVGTRVLGRIAFGLRYRSRKDTGFPTQLYVHQIGLLCCSKCLLGAEKL